MMKPLLDANDKVLLLSGASGGVGQAICADYLDAGGRVVALDRQQGDSGDSLLSIQCDLTNPSDVTLAVQAAIDRFGRIDAVVHAAGVVGHGRLEDMPLEDWHRIMDANLTSAFLLSRAVHKALKTSSGSMVLLGSTNGTNGGSELSGAAYAASKAAISNLARHLAKAWAPDIRVNVVAPGPIQTPMLDRLNPDQLSQLKASLLTGELIQANEVAASVSFLLSHHARSITGTTLNLSGGLVLS